MQTVSKRTVQISILHGNLAEEFSYLSSIDGTINSFNKNYDKRNCKLNYTLHFHKQLQLVSHKVAFNTQIHILSSFLLTSHNILIRHLIAAVLPHSSNFLSIVNTSSTYFAQWFRYLATDTNFLHAKRKGASK